MELFDDPRFWEVLAAFLILLFAAPLVYLISIVLRIVCEVDVTHWNVKGVEGFD